MKRTHDMSRTVFSSVQKLEIAAILAMGVAIGAVFSLVTYISDYWVL